MRKAKLLRKLAVNLNLSKTAILIAIMCVVALNSCGDNDPCSCDIEYIDYQKELIGTWEHYEEDDYRYEIETFKFNNDGSFIYTYNTTYNWGAESNLTVKGRYEVYSKGVIAMHFTSMEYNNDFAEVDFFEVSTYAITSDNKGSFLIFNEDANRYYKK